MDAIDTAEPGRTLAPGSDPESADDLEVAAQEAAARPGFLARLSRPVTHHLDAVPLRAKLVALLILLIVAPLVATGYVSQAMLRGYLLGELNRTLRDTAAGAVGNAVEAAQNPEARTPPLGEYVVSFIRVTRGGLITSVITPDPTNQRSFPALPALTISEPGMAPPPIHTVAEVSGPGHWLVLTGQFTNRDSIVYAQVALPTRHIDDAVARLGVLVFGVGLMATGLAGLIGWAAIRRAFRPLGQIERTAAAIAAGDLTQRAPEQPITTEVGSLTASLNVMLGRIEAAFRAQEASEARTRRFAADASHELRTPLASIRGFAELFRQGAVPADAVPRTMRRIEDEATRMGGLVEDLLLLARLDEQRPGRTDPVDLLVLAGDATHDVRGLDPSRTVTLIGLDGGGPRSATILGDEDRLRQVVANLIGNAIRHTPAGTPIEVAVGLKGTGSSQRAVFEVRDHGPGLGAEQAARVFERFYRVDSSRWRGQGGGAGLGLSIVAAVIAAHKGRIEVRVTEGGGATFAFDLPQNPS